MSQPFGEFARPTDTISAILGTYPFSIGLLRELIQNSDDAGASKQVFVLDRRNHPKRTLFDAKLSDTQGPALLAFNDALFSEEDWEALQSIHRSSKKTDTSKIGKYGIGFRSCYHVTDNPQILSGSFLAILDPHHDFAPSGGTKLDYIADGARHADQLTGFEFFLPASALGAPLSGSVIRLPLRTARARSSISSKVVEPEEVRALFDDFVREEIGMALLFLKHVKVIEMHEVDEGGGRRCLATATIGKGREVHWEVEERDEFSTRRVVVDMRLPEEGEGTVSRDWRILQSRFPPAHSASLMSFRAGRDARPVLEKHKLLPELSMAVPLSGLDSTEGTSGRLFTFLPLPIRTGFLAHLHGLFALTQSRQNLRNSTEVGIVKGSDDSVLIEWNQILFDFYLPKTWTALLTTLIRDDHFQDIYQAFPPFQPLVQTGDSIYWQSLPMKVLTTIVTSGASVWPLVAIPTGNAAAKVGVEFTDLGSAFVAPTRTDEAMLMALVRAGLRIIRPPGYILEMMEESTEIKFTSLTPEIAYRALLDHVADLVKLGTSSPNDCSLILAYLLVSQNLNNIVGLPIVQLTGGQLVSLVPSVEGTNIPETVYILLERVDCEIFTAFDRQAISLQSLPSSIANLLRTAGPKTLNVSYLTPSRVVQYLNSSPNPLGFDFTKGGQTKSIDDAAVDWLSRFWVWLAGWESALRGELFGLISGLYLLPSRNGLLERVGGGIFSETGIDSPLFAALQSTGLAFLHPKFSSAARNALGASFPGVVIPSTDVHMVIDHMQVPRAGALTVDQSMVLLAYVARWVPELCRQKPLSEEQRKKLRAWPIYPVLVPSSAPAKPDRTSRILSTLHLKVSRRNISKAIKAIPEDAVARGIAGATSMLLPTVRGVLYLDGTSVDLALLPHLEPSSATPLSDLDILGLALENFFDQSKYLQNEFMEHMVQTRDTLPPRIMSVLQNVKFIPVLDGSLQAPGHIIDPKSPLRALFSQSGDRIPRTAGRGEDDTVLFLRQLRALGLLRSQLAPEIITERIAFISSSRNSNSEMSRSVSLQLLDLLFTSGFDCSQVEFPLDAKWLPTNRGMAGHEECLDKGLHRPELFDEVFPLLDESINVSQSLRFALGWDKPLPLSVLIQQLRLVIERKGIENTYKKLRAIIKEFGQRDLSDEDIRAISSITMEHLWIPISAGRLSTTAHAVFVLPLPLRGFHEIPHTFSDRPDIRKFLLRMGCSERPSTAMLTTELKKLKDLPPSSSTVDQALQILKALPLELTDTERADILVPDSEYNLRPVVDVSFNDLGDRGYFEAGDQCLAHPQLDDQTARLLRMKRLGLKSLGLDKPEIDMGENLTTTIRNVLKQYTEQQILAEFLANASDAGADELKVLIDKRYSPDSKLLSPAMAPFQSCPSLIIYNNGTFSQKDFEGICRTGIGGKEGKTNTIGQFGLGALSMFHFTELAMILSGDKVLFLNPSKMHLPFEDWASLLVPLSQMQRLYPDHLATVDGLFDYKLTETTFYPGTIFRLPLRNESHITSNSILQTSRTPQYVRDKVVRTYWSQAQQSLIFTQIKSISTWSRNEDGVLHQGWSLVANRFQRVRDPNSHNLRIMGRVAPNAGVIEDEWEVATTLASITDLPSEFSSLIEIHRLRSPIKVGIAARVSADRTFHAHNLFSTLPLPMLTTLPVHLTASFILTPDRRHIRFDDYDNLESKYNRWLLTNLAPPLYLLVLEDLLHSQGRNDPWWPGNTTQQDSVTRILVDSFYGSHLGASQRIVCSSMFASKHYFPPSKAVMLGVEPPLITKVLSLFPNPRYVRFPPIIRERSLGILGAVDPTFLQTEIKHHAGTLQSLFARGKLTPEDIQCILDFLFQDPDLELDRLPLLPLANNTLTELDHRGSLLTRYVWKPHVEGRTLFHPHHLVHPEFDATELMSKGYNIIIPKSTDGFQDGFRVMIREHIPMSETLSNTTAEQEAWIAMFWDEYPHFVSPPDVLSFPLVRTIRRGYYVSLSKCSDSSVLLAGYDIPEWLCTCLDALGATIVMRTDSTLSQMVRDYLVNRPIFSFDRVMQYLESSKVILESRLDVKSHAQFAEWVRFNIYQNTPAPLREFAKTLPIWPVLRPQEDGVILRRSTEVEMLPFGMQPDVAIRFFKTPVVEYTSQLLALGVQSLDYNAIFRRLDFSTTLNTEDRAVYKRLLTAAISNLSFDPINAMVPNGNGDLVPANTLYSRHPFFIAAFGTAAEKFMLESYIDLENRLADLGLKTHINLDLDTFMICARAISEDSTGENRVQRALVIFRTYSEDLPLRIGSDQDDSWRRAESLRFIPRESIRQKSMRILESSEYVKHLPDLVSPLEVLRSNLEAICWTQRALFLVPPDSRVLISNQTLGVPTTAEVVEHLCVLALQVARDHPSNPYVLSDLKATYDWLDQHQDEAEDIIINLHDKRIFLNVDDPHTESWTWHSADEMFFNITNEGGDLKMVHKFLEPYRDLLYVSGVEEILKPVVPTPTISSAQAKLDSLYSGFNLMRVEGKLTDVVFITEDEQRFPAHRAVLAPMSEYLQDLFCGEFTESGPASSSEPIEIDVEYTGPCFQAVLEYLYTGSSPDLDTLKLSDALDALDLSQYWGITELNQLIQASIIRGNFITPHTYEEILARSTALDAKLVLVACQFYERENKDAIQRLKGDYSGPRRPRRIPKKPQRPLDSTPGQPPTTVIQPTSKRVRKLMSKLTHWSRKSISKS